MSQPTNKRVTVRRIALTALCVLGLVIADLGLPLLRMYVASSLFAACLMYLFRKPPIVDVVLMAILGPAATALHCWLWFGVWYKPAVFLILSGFGIAAFMVLSVRLVWAGEEKKQEILEILLPAGALTAILFASTWLNSTGKLWPSTLDLYAYSFDASLGFQPSFWTGRAFHNHLWFGLIGTGVYFSVLLGMVLAHIAHQKYRPNNISRTFMLNTCFVAAVIGYGFYQLYPACGPAYAFPREFPFGGLAVRDVARLALEPLPLNPMFPRNAMPSLHMTWALLIWWNMRGCGWWLHVCAFLFALFTAFGTMGTGEHYLIDLVVAFPFTLFIQAVSCWHIPFAEPRRWKGMLAGLVMTLVWLAVLRVGIRLFWISPVIPWTSIVVTIATSLYLSLPLTRFNRFSEPSSLILEPALAASATATRA
jgi:hypothetical protein